MKKLLLLLMLSCSISSYAQIKLEENKTIQQKSQKSEYLEISKIGKYQAAILAFAMLCKFPEDESQLLLDNYFAKLNNSSMSEEEKLDLNKEYSDEFKRLVDLNGGKSPEELSCSKFKIEYDKIIKYIKDKDNKK